MGRLLAIDYGTKRTGIAVSDPLKIIATGLKTVPTVHLLSFLKEYVNKEPIETIVIGYPKQMNNEPSESLKHIEGFVKKLKIELPAIEVVYYDERFTSVMAQRAILEGGARKKERQDKSLVDEISAVILLQSYMESFLYNNKI